MGTTRLGSVRLAAAGLTLVAAFFSDFPVAGLGAAVYLGTGFSGQAVFVAIDCSGTSVTGLGEGFGLGGGVMVPLLGRVPGPLSFRSGSVACGDALSATLGHLLCKRRPRFLQLYTSTVVPRVGTTQLFPRGGSSTGEVEAHTRDEPGYVTAVTLRVSKALTALALQWTLWSHLRLNQQSQVAEFCE